MKVIDGELEEKNELDTQLDREIEKKPRSATLLNLKWLAERLRKARIIKQNLQNGTYRIDTKRIAKAILNQDE